METKQRDSSEVLRLIESSPDREQDTEPQAELQSAGIDPDAFIFRVRRAIDDVLGRASASPSILRERRSTRILEKSHWSFTLCGGGLDYGFSPPVVSEARR